MATHFILLNCLIDLSPTGMSYTYQYKRYTRKENDLWSERPVNTGTRKQNWKKREEEQKATIAEERLRSALMVRQALRFTPPN